MTARLSGELPPEFSRPVIDRAQPLRFRVNGRAFNGFAGDTVLSALLASGTSTAGMLAGSPLALDEHTAPAIALAGNEERPDLAMPMALCPAVDGASFTTLGPRPGAPASLLSRLLMRRRDSLGLLYRSGSAEPGGWIDTPAARHVAVDVAIVGGGVAGLSAALAATRRGLRVCLLEKEPVLGGLSVYYGKADGEPAPEDMIADLVAKLGETGLITLLPATLAFDLEAGRIEAVRVTVRDSIPQPERISIAAETVVLATGTLGALPIFAGNRLPGVVEAGFAWRMAARYNVWPGRDALIHTATNVGYRMALLGAASGKTILRTGDQRIDPQTRFIEFCKAYGYRLGWGNAVAAVSKARRGTLSVALADAETGAPSGEPVACDCLIVAAARQPDLDLWVRAGGGIGWDAEHLAPSGTLDGVVLAGSVAGYRSLAGCADHGRAALDGKEQSVPDPQIDPIFETPDGRLTVSHPQARNAAPAFLAAGATRRLATPPARGWGRLIDLAADRMEPWGALSLSEITGEIVAGRLDPAFAANLCAERCVLPRLVAPTEPEPQVHHHASEGLPTYLEHRFGSGQSQWTLAPGEARRFDPGCLIFANTDHHAPLDAIGVVLADQSGTLRALLDAQGMKPGDVVYVRDGMNAVPVRLAETL